MVEQKFPKLTTYLSNLQADLQFLWANARSGSSPDYCTAQTKVSYRVLRL